MWSAPVEVIVTSVPEATDPPEGSNIGVGWVGISCLVTYMVYVFGVLPDSVETTVIVASTPGVKAMGADAKPEAVVVPFTVSTPVPVGVTVIEETA